MMPINKATAERAAQYLVEAPEMLELIDDLAKRFVRLEEFYQKQTGNVIEGDANEIQRARALLQNFGRSVNF